jgi:hypothetical protein
MTVIPILKTPLNLDKEIIREGLKKLIFTCENSTGICSFIHLDLLYPQKMLIKVQHQEESGSLKDIIYNNNVSFL